MKFASVLGLSLLSARAAAFVPAKTAFTPGQRAPATAWENQGHYSSLFSRDTRLFQTVVEQQEDYYIALATQYEGYTRPEIVYIMMYNPGTQDEGVHSTEYPKGSGTEVVLAFESLEECNYFSSMLREDPNFPLEPIPTPAPLEQMEMSCQQMGVPMKIVPAYEE
eukprot:CAMPEP_0183293946 /NCGR_PEP_ID=MMETSP0160_2-20130417/2455_1 /TAXON_ID=2839 ORGANISM="Odontella Sinensis, Strain Grunow 1884" /NCGR_SAMPLE_ID=MMETSP0160_2 /ASSEMBLY_ACC=CAM_ASM_000250 /LENGTH=164 /DNA_ID=CAMNT_0025455163 /DNA_START=85 /DNA_END=579 /DNA_ORIENTATION=+